MVKNKRKRFFNAHERITLFLHAAGRCRLCDATLELGDWHGDHVTAFSRGGETNLANGQALCAACNLRKSDRDGTADSE